MRKLDQGLVKIGLIFLSLMASCQEKDMDYDASGVFEAEEIMVPAEVTGIVRKLDLVEGQLVKTGDVLGFIDSTQLHLKKQQLLAQLTGIESRLPQIEVQTAALKKQMGVVHTQIRSLEIEMKRVENLIKVNAATPKQLDDINGQLSVLYRQLEVLEQQYQGQKSVLGTQSKGLASERKPLFIQIEQIDDQLEKCVLRSPMEGTILAKYIHRYEMAAPGKVLYKLADLSTLSLRAYITGDQLPSIRLGQKVEVWTDSGREASLKQEGEITWISDKAEFTPKTIQTKKERANMVYAMKVRVPNDGGLKVGMYGEVRFR
ncbi:HlyD family secretion protein [Dyadobacter tibetensis]|uniref:HlyD family secretion protein n=1 Tax=Dyadobacter tibetensis TaxID=1211851 RepID=UPI00046F35A5|nr:efflux RND transporter periplasmic adaptor subunit [Dyadobacter tibetensis]